MKTIKDTLQASSIEQRRRILNNIGIDKDSKNFIVKGEVSQTNGGGSDSNIIYYKVLNSPAVGQLGHYLNNSYFNVTPYIGDGELTKPIIMFGTSHPILKNGVKINFITFAPFEVEGIKIDTLEYFLELVSLNPKEIVERSTREEFYNLNY